MEGLCVSGMTKHQSDILYFTGAPVFQSQSPATQNDATWKMKSPVFQLGPVSHQSPHTVTHFIGHAWSP